jgi:FkbM family methyltransferase
MISVLRKAGRRLPGFFPLVAERVHPRLNVARHVVLEQDGFAIRLDLSEYIQRRIFYGCHEPYEARFVARFLRPGDSFFDIGAHVGYFTLIAAREVGSGGAVHAFEPHPANFAALKENTALNAFRHVTLNQAAVSDTSGTAQIGVVDPTLLGRSTGDFTIGGEHGSVQVECVSLDDYAGRLDARPIRLLKIDVEGLEPAVLEGARRILSATPPDAILFEYNQAMLEAKGFAPPAVFAHLERAGYLCGRFSAFGRLKRIDRPPEAGRPHREEPVRGSALRAGIAHQATLFNVLAWRPAAGVRAR